MQSYIVSPKNAATTGCGERDICWREFLRVERAKARRGFFFSFRAGDPYNGVVRLYTLSSSWDIYSRIRRLILLRRLAFYRGYTGFYRRRPFRFVSSAILGLVNIRDTKVCGSIEYCFCTAAK